MENQPWHFDRHTLALSNVSGESKPSEIPLFEASFWVRVYDLPLVGRSSETNARNIGNKVGTFMAVDKSDVVGINKSLRVRTMIDLREPLKKEITLKLRGGISQQFGVKYERLPLFCYYCGKLGHGDKDCEQMLHMAKPKRMFSDKLRASPWQVNKVVEVDEEIEEKKTCARRLFVVKETTKTISEVKEKVSEVTKQLEEVTLSLGNITDDGDHNGVGEFLMGSGRVGLSEVEGREVQTVLQKDTEPATEIHCVDQVLTFSVGHTHVQHRGLKKVQKVTRNRAKSVGEANVCGKRKDAMDIDEIFYDEGGSGTKKSKAVMEMGDRTNDEVAEVAEQPREHQ